MARKSKLQTQIIFSKLDLEGMKSSETCLKRTATGAATV